jgi:hypothetical protein
VGPSLARHLNREVAWFVGCLHDKNGLGEQLDMTVHEKFVEDMNDAGIHTEGYLGRFFWKGPAARSDEQNGPTLLDILKVTAVPLQWDRLDCNYMVYPVGKAWGGSNDKVADSEDEESEPDGYNDGYATSTAKDDGDDEED